MDADLALTLQQQFKQFQNFSLKSVYKNIYTFFCIV